MPRLIVGLTGPIGSGKSTVASEFCRYGFTRVRFAGPLKKMMTVLGLSIDQVDGSAKETPSELLCGKTPRHAMQTIGTEWGRDLIGPDLWVNAWKHAVSRLPDDMSVVADDLRFENEAAAVRALGGIIVRVQRNQVYVTNYLTATHASEQFDFDPDSVIHNDSTIEQLAQQVRFMVVGLAQGVTAEDAQMRDTQRVA